MKRQMITVHGTGASALDGFARERLLGLTMISFALIFAAAQLFHPFGFQIGHVHDAEAWIANFRGQRGLHLAHALEFLCAPLLLIIALEVGRVVRKHSRVLGWVGTVMAVIGSLMLLGNKSALCLTISAFDTLDDAALQAMVPGLQSLLDRAGWMWMLSFLPLLPLGFLALSIGLLRDREIPRGEAVFLCVGSAMLANPEIQVINFFASFVLAAGFFPLGLRMLRGRGWGGSRTDAPAGAPSKEKNILGQPARAGVIS